MTLEEAKAKLELDSVIEWIKAQDQFEEYEYVDNFRCPIAKILGNTQANLRFLVFPDKAVSKDFEVDIPKVTNSIFLNRPHKYKDALERALTAKSSVCEV